MEITLVKAVTIHDQPAQYGMVWSDRRIDARTQPGQARAGPASADVHHIDMVLACSGQKVVEALSSRHGPIQQGQCHGCAFIGKTPVHNLDGLQLVWEISVMAGKQRGMVSVQKRAPNLLQPLTRLRARTMKSTPREIGLAHV